MPRCMAIVSFLYNKNLPHQWKMQINDACLYTEHYFDFDSDGEYNKYQLAIRRLAVLWLEQTSRILIIFTRG